MPETVVRPHASQHDAIEDLPLVTDSATVTGVEALDENRREEAIDAIERTLAEAGVDASPEAFGAARSALVEAGRPDLARRVATLAERCERPVPMLVRVRLSVDDGEFDYLAGQYVGLRYDGTSRAYSLASSPTGDELELCVRRVPGGRLSPQLCDRLAVGDSVTIRGPHGDLLLQDPSPRDQAFLATGTGVAPFRGMVRYLLEEDLDRYEGRERDVWVFLGAAWADDLPYRELFRALDREHDHVHFVPTCSREPAIGPWAGETDYVQHTFLEHVDDRAVTGAVDRRVERWLASEPDSGVDARLDPTNLEVYACGLDAMVHGLVGAAEAVGVPPACIDSEGFG
jgi:ferredoxin-NADP reductase